MTISSTARKAGPFTGNGSATSFAFTFKVFSSADIAVTSATSAGVESLLVLDTDYTVTLNANQDTSPGGSITYPITGSPLPTGAKLTIVGDLDFDQPLDLPAGGNFSPIALENELDRIVMQIQQLDERADRGLTLPVNSAANPVLPAAEAGEVLGWDQTASALVNYSIDELITSVTFADWTFDTFTGDGSATAFALGSNPGSLGNVDVTVNGLSMVPGVDFSLSGSTIAFTAAPGIGDEILVRYGESAVQGGLTVTTERQLATASQTVFTLANAYTPGANNVSIYVNGVRLSPGIDFAETSANVVTMTAGLALNDEVLFVVGGQVAQAVGSGNVGWTQAGSGAVARTVQDKLRERLSVRDFGALGDDVTDDLAAFNLATTALAPWQTLYIPPGQYRLSNTWIIQNKYRHRIICEGVLKPHGAHTDYLVKFTNNTGDPLVPSMGQQGFVKTLWIDCEWKCRGVFIEKSYETTFEQLMVWRPYGHGLKTPMLQEVTFIQPAIISGKARVDATITAAAVWSNATTYTVGQVVKGDYPTYAAGTTYAKDDAVLSAGFAYRSLIASNLGNTPVSNADKWERIPIEYFEATALAGNLNKNPHDASTDYSTRSSIAGNKFWEPVYPDEAAWEMAGEGATIDNCKVWNFITRANAHDVVMRVDSREQSLAVLKLELFACQFHSLTSAYVSAFNADPAYTAAYGGTISNPTCPVMLWLADSSNTKIFGGQFQCGNLAYCKGILVGGRNVGMSNPRGMLIGTHIEGTAGGSNQVGISVQRSTESFGSQWYQEGLSNVLPGTNCVEKWDLDGETVREIFGSATLTKGTSSVAIVFDQPLMAVPNLRLTISGGSTSKLDGLSIKTESETTTGFTALISGLYHGPVQTKSFTSGGGANQDSTYAHSSGVTAAGYMIVSQSADTGIDFRTFAQTNDANTLTVRAPAAPTNTTTCKWVPLWEDVAPVDITIDYQAVVAGEI